MSTKETNITFRSMTEADLDAVTLLEQRIFSDAWPREAFEQDVDSANSGFILAESDGVLCGYAGYLIGGGEAQLINIAVAPEYRGKSIAKTLLNYILEIAQKADCENIFLEVRPSNQAAIGLYRKFGFLDLYCRPNYYHSPTEDALVMVKNLREG